MKIIVSLAMFSYGVFLIHIHPLVAGMYLDGHFAWIAQQPCWLMVISVFLVAGIIYVLCIPIEMIRVFIFKICKVNLCSEIVICFVKKLTFKVKNLVGIKLE